MEDEPTNTFNTPPPEPVIALPISQFLQILWGYKKHADLRERAVPGEDIVEALRAIPNYEQWYHIQDEEGCESTVWQKDFWKGTGVREQERNKKLDTLWGGIDSVIETLRPKFPMFQREALRVFADGLIQERQWTTLRGMGVDTTELEKAFGPEL